jgi:hypothetical protein
MDMKATAAKIKELRAKGQDKTLPQEVRNRYLDKANELEYAAYESSKGMAKGGAVKKAAPKKMACGGMAKKTKK